MIIILLLKTGDGSNVPVSRLFSRIRIQGIQTSRKLSLHSSSARRILLLPGSSGPLTYLHFHNCVEIGICHAGGKDLYVEDSHERFCTGDISVIPPYTIHISQNREGQEGEDCEYLYFSPEELLKPFYPNGLPEHLLWYNRNQAAPVYFPWSVFVFCIS